MKFRNGFVSNSSSSSFIAFAEKTDYDKAFEQLNEEEQRILSFFPPATIKYKNKDFVKIVDTDYDGEIGINQNGYIDGNDIKKIFPEYTSRMDRYEYQRDIQNAINKLISKLQKNKSLLEHTDYH